MQDKLDLLLKRESRSKNYSRLPVSLIRGGSFTLIKSCTHRGVQNTGEEVEIEDGDLITFSQVKSCIEMHGCKEW